MTSAIYPIYIFAFIFTLLLTVVAERIIIPRLTRKAAQPIYEEGPKWHISKSGTPTMGGLGFLVAITVTIGISIFLLLYLGNNKGALSLTISLVFSLLNAAVGIVDDLFKIRRKDNGGLTARQKIILQSVIVILFLAARWYFLDDEAVIRLPLITIDAAWLYYPVSFLLLLGVVNCANLTDGIDGLASGIAFAVGAAFFFIGAFVSSEIGLLSAALMGAAIGFLFFNIHPAKIFMGDTGSLMLGAIAVSMGFMTEVPMIILPIGIVYVIEGASVILQVLVYKTTRKRLFKMAPLHHHLERCGYSETTICIFGILLTILSSTVAFTFFIS